MTSKITHGLVAAAAVGLLAGPFVVTAAALDLPGPRTAGSLSVASAYDATMRIHADTEVVVSGTCPRGAGAVRDVRSEYFDGRRARVADADQMTPETFTATATVLPGAPTRTPLAVELTCTGAHPVQGSFEIATASPAASEAAAAAPGAHHPAKGAGHAGTSPAGDGAERRAAEMACVPVVGAAGYAFYRRFRRVQA
ncbi:hypothetical protein ACIQWN_32445 [Streptomyces vinaceus]|uniref:hypothetical protein n=1 Tax=Streptomyces vinaceus TaxID=1960 RepID=UPI00382C6FB8